MKKAFLIFILCFVSLAQSQEKKRYFLDSDLKTQYPEEVFIAKNYNKDYSTKNHIVYIENDTSYISFYHPKKKYGKLKSVQLDSLKSYINSISHKKEKLSNYIVINYFDAIEPKPCDTLAYYMKKWSIYKKDYLKELNKTIPNNQFYIYRNYIDINCKTENVIKFSDTYNVIKELFFPYYIRFGSYILIKPDGRYVIVYGDHNKNHVIQSAKEISKSDQQSF